MARVFNGTTSDAALTIDLSAYSLVSLSCHLWWPTFNASARREVFEYAVTDYVTDSGFLCTPEQPTSRFLFGFGKPGISWTDWVTPNPLFNTTFCHLGFVFDRATPANAIWIQGAPQSINTQIHDAGTYGNFGNTTLHMGSRGGTTFFGPFQLAEFAIWGGVALSDNQMLGLNDGEQPPFVAPDALVCYAPLLGDSNEANYAGSRNSFVLTSTTTANHAPARTHLMRRSV